MNNPVISVKNLTVSYDKNVVIKSASFEIFRKDFLCVVGANGSGKSTLIRALLGLIQPVSGKIKYGEDIKHNSIGFLPQETKIEQNFPATVFEIVLSGTLGRFKHRFFYSEEAKKAATDALRQLGILKIKERSFSNLSGGQKQKVLLARALVATSEILILDEPSNSLDYKSRKDFYEMLKKLNDSGLTIIMITHDLDADDLIGNKVLSIKECEVSCESTDKFLRRYK
ncbi:ABC transporter ATP-binding protein [Candidatus Saccharibacteria bacterium]|nr:ABC transporter ATP-binding protein [Candidatus Saccharibacteria bacterium]